MKERIVRPSRGRGMVVYCEYTELYRMGGRRTVDTGRIGGRC